MAVAFDAASTNGGAGSITQAHVCTGSGLILLVGIIDWTGADANALTVNPQYNGSAMTLLGTHAFNTARVEIWYLVNPTTGTHNITYSNSTPEAMVAGSFNGVDTSSPFGTVSGNTGNSSTPSSSAITIPTGDMMVDFLAILCGAGATVGSGFTQLGTVAPCNPKAQVAYQAGVGGSLTDNWTGYSQDNRWANLAVQLKAPAAGVTPHRLMMMGVGK
jgi:hypothetical protein